MAEMYRLFGSEENVYAMTEFVIKGEETAAIVNEMSKNNPKIHEIKGT